MRPTLRLIQATPLLFLALASAPVHAQSVTVDVNEGVCQHFRLDAKALDDSITGVIQENLHLVDLDTYLVAMANAAMLSTKGMGVDYASNVRRFEVGGGVGTSVNGAGIRLGRAGKEIPDFGFAFQVTGMAGLNAGFLVPGAPFLDRFVIYANGMMANTSQDHIDGRFENVGGHLQFKAFKGINARVVRWGGLDLTSGLEYTGYHLDLNQPLPIQGTMDTLTLTWDAEGTYTLDTTGLSVPVELSTNVRALFLTGFAGMAVDLNDALGVSRIKLAGDVDGLANGTHMALGQALVSKYGHGRGDDVVGRLFAGAQFNVLMVKLYGQANWGLNGGFGGHAGVRAVF